MSDFTGKRFFADETVPPIKQVDIYGNITYKPVFRMTRSYVNYIKAKEAKAKQLEIQKLKEKLEFEFEKYGEVDDVDYQRFMQLIKQN